MRFKVSIIGFIAAIFIFAVIVIKSITLNQNCTGYLKRAADASTVELALQELNVSIKYLEGNDLTDGYTSVLYRTPSEDLSFWYLNLKGCQKELKAAMTRSQLEQTNTLMKLRETLTDNGARLTVPNGLSRYPHNELYAFLLAMGSILATWFLIEIIIKDT